MQERIAQFNWADELGAGNMKNFRKHKHELLKYRLLTFLEQHLLGGRQVLCFKNYKLSDH